MSMANDILFKKMVDELVLLSHNDPDLENNIKWLDDQARMKGITFYDIVSQLIYKNDVLTKAKSWMREKRE